MRGLAQPARGTRRERIGGRAVLLATAFSCLPTLEKWPLPTGLGGASGDLVLGVLRKDLTRLLEDVKPLVDES